ncbi:MAG: molybdopterin-guanine dinucleotide biosynthesis protein B [Hyphomicrobiales bacterium]|nr:MAG: molybdopterin-guanine dinucleotide biosynthesis protein B [Hyphomicrobiales bacterium]
MSTKTPVFGITGWKNTGKTTLVTRLVSEFTQRGYCVSTIKHAHHNFDIDQKGRDSYKHRDAGAHEVALVSGNRWALMHELRGADEPTLEEVIERLSPCDLVLIEGYKRESHPKIESRRVEGNSKEPLAPQDPAIVAIASDQPLLEENLPVFDIDTIEEIADFIADYIKLPVPRKTNQSVS